MSKRTKISGSQQYIEALSQYDPNYLSIKLGRKARLLLNKEKAEDPLFEQWFPLLITGSLVWVSNPVNAHDAGVFLYSRTIDLKLKFVQSQVRMAKKELQRYIPYETSL
jgi:hypothetical protein